ncbi:TPM domain-containing protein [Actinoplanes sp. CA-015351]|uniref:TPM domain-containing protein n=1 Tax=Actinoplanes sp. CA-015351 TaxID=3239897 RepID=UPI003D998BC4
MRARLAFIVGSVALAVALPAPALAAPAFPAADGWCVDEAGVLGGLCDQITAILREDEAATSDEIAVAVVPTTGDASIETWSTGLFNDWGVGKAGADNGILLVVAVEDHRVRLETGRGMAQRLDDATAATIIDTVITPRLTAENYSAGILNGLDEVRRTLGHPVEPGNALADLTGTGAGSDGAGSDGAESALLGQDTDFQPPQPESRSLLPIIVFGVIAVGLLGLIGWATGRGKRGPGSSGAYHTGAATGTYVGYDSSSSSSTSSGSSFGGGSSDGGGSSGGW